MGYDNTPKFSSDGKYIAWTSMERDGYEADLNRLFMMNLETKEKTFVTRDYELWVDQFEWLEGDKGFRFLSNDQGLGNLFEIDIKSLKRCV